MECYATRVRMFQEGESEKLREKVVTENHFSDVKQVEVIFLLARYGFSDIQEMWIMSHLCNNTRPRKKVNSELQSIPVGEPFSCIGMDFKEMDESFVNNYCYALVLQDYLS